MYREREREKKKVLSTNNNSKRKQILLGMIELTRIFTRLLTKEEQKKRTLCSIHEKEYD